MKICTLWNGICLSCQAENYVRLRFEWRNGDLCCEIGADFFKKEIFIITLENSLFQILQLLDTKYHQNVRENCKWKLKLLIWQNFCYNWSLKFIWGKVLVLKNDFIFAQKFQYKFLNSISRKVNFPGKSPTQSFIHQFHHNTECDSKTIFMGG